MPMTKLCDSIDTLAMAYLDDELAEEELRDFELHLLDCGDCKGRVDRDRASIAELRRRLAPPTTPDLLRARLTRALDAEDAAASRAMRRQRVQRWVLPGAASVAAVAALALFVASRPGSPASGALAREAVRQNTRSAPLEVQGASTDAWVRKYYNPDVTPPRFADGDVQLAGARLTSIDNRDAAQFFYQLVGPGGVTHELRALIFSARGVDFDGWQRVLADGVELRVAQSEGHNVVILVDDDGYAYVFTSRDLSLEQLAGLVVRSDLVRRVHADRVAQ
jgi:anti-sigma factor RsiW